MLLSPNIINPDAVIQYLHTIRQNLFLEEAV